MSKTAISIKDFHIRPDGAEEVYEHDWPVFAVVHRSHEVPAGMVEIHNPFEGTKMNIPADDMPQFLRLLNTVQAELVRLATIIQAADTAEFLTIIDLKESTS